MAFVPAIDSSNDEFYFEAVKEYEESDGPKVAFVVTGGGVDTAKLMQAVGASSMVEAFYIPYSAEESCRFIGSYLGRPIGESFKEKAVSAKSVSLLAQAAKIRWPNCRIVACSAALTTNRWRRGENHAYIAVSEPDSPHIHMLHKKLPKKSEEDFERMEHYDKCLTRQAEDTQLSQTLLRLATGEFSYSNTVTVYPNGPEADSQKVPEQSTETKTANGVGPPPFPTDSA